MNFKNWKKDWWTFIYFLLSISVGNPNLIFLFNSINLKDWKKCTNCACWCPGCVSAQGRRYFCFHNSFVIIIGWNMSAYFTIMYLSIHLYISQDTFIQFVFLPFKGSTSTSAPLFAPPTKPSSSSTSSSKSSSLAGFSSWYWRIKR